jgi:hypothetical protein
VITLEKARAVLADLPALLQEATPEVAPYLPELFQDLTSLVGPWRGALGKAPPFPEDHGFVAEWSANLHEIPRLGSLTCIAIDIKK